MNASFEPRIPRSLAPGGPVKLRPGPAHRIEIKLRDISQLFNSMDPSPFHEKDLDRDAEEFILSWAQEYPRRDPVNLVIHLAQMPADPEGPRMVEQAVHHYFIYRAKLNELEFKRLMKQGRASLGIGLLFLALCLLLSELIPAATVGAVGTFFRESLTIAGWVAMWKPMEIYLYSWWPLRRRGQIFEKMGRMKVELRPALDSNPDRFSALRTEGRTALEASKPPRSAMLDHE